MSPSANEKTHTAHSPRQRSRWVAREINRQTTAAHPSEAGAAGYYCPSGASRVCHRTRQGVNDRLSGAHDSSHRAFGSRARLRWGGAGRLAACGCDKKGAPHPRLALTILLVKLTPGAERWPKAERGDARNKELPPCDRMNFDAASGRSSCSGVPSAVCLPRPRSARPGTRRPSSGRGSDAPGARFGDPQTYNRRGGLAPPSSVRVGRGRERVVGRESAGKPRSGVFQLRRWRCRGANAGPATGPQPSPALGLACRQRLRLAATQRPHPEEKPEGPLTILWGCASRASWVNAKVVGSRVPPKESRSKALSSSLVPHSCGIT